MLKTKFTSLLAFTLALFLLGSTTTAFASQVVPTTNYSNTKDSTILRWQPRTQVPIQQIIVPIQQPIFQPRPIIIPQPPLQYFSQLSYVPMPQNANYYESSTVNQPDGTYVMYRYSTLVMQFNFLYSYFDLLRYDGWTFDKNYTDYSGRTVTSFVKGNSLIMVGFMGNDIYIMGRIHKIHRIDDRGRDRGRDNGREIGDIRNIIGIR